MLCKLLCRYLLFVKQYIDYFKISAGGIVSECLLDVYSVCVCVCRYLSDFVETSGPVPSGVMETLESLRMIHVCKVQPSPHHTHTHTRDAHTCMQAHACTHTACRKREFNPSSIHLTSPSPLSFLFLFFSFFPLVISPSSSNRTISHIVY